MGIHIMPPSYEKLIKTHTKTFYPDASPGVTCCDGSVSQVYATPGYGVSWATLIADAGNYAEPSTLAIYAPNINADSTTNKWLVNARGIFLFDTGAEIPDWATIIRAALSLYGWFKVDNFTVPIAPDVNVYSSNPASNTTLVDGDYATLGSTPFCNNPIAYADFLIGGYNDFVLNAAGRAAISKTGITKLGTRNANYDVAAVAPTWESLKAAQLMPYAADKGGGYRPKLVVTYIG